MAGAQQKKRETDRCLRSIKLDVALRLGAVVFTQPVRIEFAWFEKNARRDPDNIRAGSKFLLDALVKLAIIPDDSQKWVHEISDEFHVDKKYPRIEIRVTPTSDTRGG